MSTSRADNFNRVDSLSLTTASDGISIWTYGTSTNFAINSNRAYNNDFVGIGFNTCVLDAGTPTVDVTVTLALNSGNSGICMRWSDNNNFISLFSHPSSNTLTIFKTVAGSTSTLAQDTGYTGANGDILVLSGSGNNISAKLNGVLDLGPVSDTFNNTATKHGLASFNDHDTRFDDFSITDNSGGGGGGGRIFRTAALDGLSCSGPKNFNPSLGDKQWQNQQRSLQTMQQRRNTRLSKQTEMELMLAFSLFRKSLMLRSSGRKT